jgi:8-oxo-dGTP pyrophosphatase MutT (NUDIX family)
MISNAIRTIALGIIRRENAILAIEWYDSVKKEQFYRPIGGGMEFQEGSRDTVIREFREEIGAELDHVHFLGALENIFIYEGKPGHEIVMIYEAAFVDKRFYDMEIIEGLEDNDPFIAKWKPLDDFRNGNSILYPTTLLHLLDGKTALRPKLG